MKLNLVSGMQVLVPDGEGPFPVVIQMHGCGGVQPMQRRYAETARQAGVAVVILDSLTPRGIGRREALLTVCTGLRLRGAERAGDLTAALAWVQAQPWADGSRLAAAGWSHGAWSIMDALAADTHPALARLKLAVLIYPYAGPLSQTARCGWGLHRPKVLACLAGRDTVVGTLAPRRAIQRLEADGLDVDLLHLPEATHAFDDDGSSDPRMRYNLEHETLAQNRYRAALKTTFALTRA
jgi:dienelactone hydrolase